VRLENLNCLVLTSSYLPFLSPWLCNKIHW